MRSSFRACIDVCWLHQGLNCLSSILYFSPFICRPRWSHKDPLFHEHRTLLSVAIDNHSVKLLQAILASINILVRDPSYLQKAPAGLPYFDATELQRAMSAFPRETVEAMDGLWGLTKVSGDEPLWRKSGERRMKASLWKWCCQWEKHSSEQESKHEQSTSCCSSLSSSLVQLYQRSRCLLQCSSLLLRCRKRWAVAPKPVDSDDAGATVAGEDEDGAENGGQSRQQLLKACFGKVWNAITCSLFLTSSGLDTCTEGDTDGNNKQMHAVVGIPMVEWTLCVPGMCSMGADSFLATCVRTAEQLGDDTGIFEKPAIQTLLEYKWESYAKTYFLILWAISLALAINFSLYSYYSDLLGGSQRLVWVICLAINLLPLILQEVAQLCVMRRASLASSSQVTDGPDRTSSCCLAVKRYVSSTWNMIDVVTYLALLVAIILRHSQPYGKSCYIISAAVSLLLWLKLLYYFRGFQSTGVLVRAVIQITRDIRFFLVILVVFILVRT